MRFETRWRRFLVCAASVGAVCLGSGRATAYPGGTPDFQTDVGPFCAACHASTSLDDLSGLGERATAELAPNKHLAAIRAGAGKYAELSDADRARLVELISAVDQNSTIQLEFPAQVAPGETFQVTVKVTGGAGPAIGVGLVDRPHRFFARPASAEGWEVVGAPTIIGPKGPQSDWIARRPEREGRNITFVNVEGIQSDAEQNRWSRAKIIYTLKAPNEAGDYPLVGAYFYGTETAVAMSTRKTPEYGVQPLGGVLGKSGRVKFSETAVISVKEAPSQPAADPSP
ncbi:MAG TPA: hypothetical protein ENI85_11620 [Deltaproteobacteria bacterium]|nr:hypothetical protein [Deltaproteobacteria bacterium]